MTYKIQRILQGSLRDTCINTGLNQLRNRPGKRRHIRKTPTFNDVVWLNLHLIKHHAATGGSALTKCIPVVNHLYARRIRGHPDLHATALLIGGAKRNPVREQSASGIKARAADAQAAICLPTQLRGEIRNPCRFALFFGSGIAQTRSLEHGTKPALLLRLRAGVIHVLDQGKMVLRNLPQ